MKHFAVTIVVVLVFGSALLVNEQYRVGEWGSSRDCEAEALSTSSQPAIPARTVRAPGRIEGSTETIELLSRVSEQIESIAVHKGQWVRQGEVLVQLDKERLREEHSLAEAMLEMSRAKRMRVENGFRKSEIETARQEYLASNARLAGAEKAYARAVRLAASDAISQQVLDDRLANLNSLRSLASAAAGRLETVESPPRADDLLAAQGSERAAEARLRLAAINLQRCQIKAPVDGQILAIHAEVGELTGPNAKQPLIVMADTKRLRAVAEVDEYDALAVQVGNVVSMTCDGLDGTLARGQVVEVEPQMNPKRMFGQWAGERNDTFTRRVWIAIEGEKELPVGLPVDVLIEVP